MKISIVCLFSQSHLVSAFLPSMSPRVRQFKLYDYDSSSEDANKWISTDETYEKIQDWESDVAKRKDGSLWSSFESSEDDDSSTTSSSTSTDLLDDGEAWLDALASVAADEIEFINVEAERADKVRQMQEWGFEAETIKNALDVAIDDSAEIDVENDMLEKFKEETAKSGFGMYLDDEIDMETVESHVSTYCDCNVVFLFIVTC